MDIVMLADKGGVGKSTLAFHVAARLQQLGRDVACIDLDRRRALLEWAGLADEPYLPIYTEDDLPLVRHEYRVWDTPAHPSLDLRQGLLATGARLCIVTELDPVSQRAALDLLRWCLDAGCDARLLINNVQPNSADGQATVEMLQRAGLPHCQRWVRGYRCYQRAQWDGRAVCDGPYASADNAWSDICAVTAELIGE